MPANHNDRSRSSGEESTFNSLGLSLPLENLGAACTLLFINFRLNVLLLLLRNRVTDRILLLFLVVVSRVEFLVYVDSTVFERTYFKRNVWNAME